jgi:hypothetical protein
MGVAPVHTEGSSAQGEQVASTQAGALGSRQSSALRQPESAVESEEASPVEDDDEVSGVPVASGEVVSSTAVVEGVDEVEVDAPEDAPSVSAASGSEVLQASSKVLARRRWGRDMGAWGA